MTAITRASGMWISLLAGFLLISGSFASAEALSKIRVGTYDSRFVALAYYRSDQGSAFMREFQGKMNADLDKAKKEKDEKHVKELEAMGPAMQNLMHQQVFGNLSIPNVLKTINDRLPELAKKADVSLIVSKWDIRCQSSDIECVDITGQIIELFHPSEEILKMIEGYSKQAKEPVPIERLLNPFE